MVSAISEHCSNIPYCNVVRNIISENPNAAIITTALVILGGICLYTSHTLQDHEVKILTTGDEIVEEVVENANKKKAEDAAETSTPPITSKLEIEETKEEIEETREITDDEFIAQCNSVLENLKSNPEETVQKYKKLIDQAEAAQNRAKLQWILEDVVRASITFLKTRESKTRKSDIRKHDDFAKNYDRLLDYVYEKTQRLAT
ncbi:MAG: hypothetical protein K1000chlam3_01433 [Chlamydiae bacterium]|nr:hypothetical protein [Chlamydiota bacterium]